jgi:hypothetical protein
VNVSYTEPLSRAWARMKRVLFQPFHFERWMVIGFASFLAYLLRSGGGSVYSWQHEGWRRSPSVHAEHALEAVRDRMLHVLENPVVLLVIAAVLVGLMVLALVLAWVGARAEFVFLENVATGRGEFVAPWGRSRRLGTSLFLWRAVFSFAYLLPLAFVAFAVAGPLLQFARGETVTWPGVLALLPPLGLACLLLLAFAWVLLLLEHFVVPLMYRHDETTGAAWARFWPLFSSRPMTFFAYAVFVVLLEIAAGIALFVGGVATCCIGLVLLLVPYVGSVVKLPVSVTLRALGPEFIAQFGPEWAIFAPEPAEDDEVPPAPPPPAPVAGGPPIG